MNISADKETAFNVICEALSCGNGSFYGEGMDNIAIAYLNREKAKNPENNAVFADVYTVNGSVNTLDRELSRQKGDVLLTSNVNVYGSEYLCEDENYTQLFKKTISAIRRSSGRRMITENKPIKKAVIPIGCQEANMPGHNICVVLEQLHTPTPKASIIDQLGGNAYLPTKQKIVDDLSDCGFSEIQINFMPWSQNRNDCATFVSCVTDDVLAQNPNNANLHDNVKAVDDSIRESGTYYYSTKEIDETHTKDCTLLFKAAENLVTEIYGPIDRREILSGTAIAPDEIVADKIISYQQERSGPQTYYKDSYSR